MKNTRLPLPGGVVAPVATGEETLVLLVRHLGPGDPEPIRELHPARRPVDPPDRLVPEWEAELRTGSAQPVPSVDQLVRAHPDAPGTDLDESDPQDG